MLSENDIQEVARAVLAAISRKPPGRWLTLPEALEYANIKSKTTMMKWLTEGVIYGFKRSGTWIVDRESIDNWYLFDAFKNG